MKTTTPATPIDSASSYLPGAVIHDIASGAWVVDVSDAGPNLDRSLIQRMGDVVLVCFGTHAPNDCAIKGPLQRKGYPHGLVFEVTPEQPAHARFVRRFAELARADQPVTMNTRAPLKDTWTRYVLEDAPAAVVVTGVEPGGPGLVAVGWAGPGTPGPGGGAADTARVWVSTDGASWSPVDALPDSEGVRLYNLTRVEGRLIAAGSRTIDEDNTRPVAWWSDDGLTWTALEAGPEASLKWKTPTSTSAIAVGTAPALERAAVWLNPPQP